MLRRRFLRGFSYSGGPGAPACGPMGGPSAGDGAAAAAFFIAHTGLGRLGEAVDFEEDDTPERLAWQQWGRIVNTLARGLPAHAIGTAWDVLEGRCLLASVDPLARYQEAAERWAPHLIDVVGACEEQIRELLELAAPQLRELTSLHVGTGLPDGRAAQFALAVLGRIGSERAADLIEPLVEDGTLGEHARSAVRRLRARYR